MTDSRSPSNAMADESTVASDFSFVEAADAGSPQALSLSVTPRHDVIGLGSLISTTQICINVKAREIADDEEHRAPVDIIIALDCSGSMSGEKLALCKKTLERLLRVLMPFDRFGLISFASEAIIEIPIQAMTAANKKSALEKIRLLSTRGSTNISGAIGLAAQEMRTVENPNEVRSIFLLTDGHANEGISDVDGVVTITKNCLVEDQYIDFSELSPPTGGILKRKRDSDVDAENPTPPISLHCFGYGENHDSSFLQNVASATSGGTYYFVDKDSNVGSAFGDAMGGILSVVAQSAVVNITVPQYAADFGVEITKVYHPQSLKRDNGTHSVTVGDFYAEESRDVLFEVKLATPLEGADGSPVAHAIASLSYTDTIEKRPVEAGPIKCTINRPPGNEVSKTHLHVLVQGLRIKATEEMAEAEQDCQAGNLASARAKIQRTQEMIERTPGVQADPVVEQLSFDLSTVAQGLDSQRSYASYGRHTMQRSVQAHRRQRCSEAAPDTPSVYRVSGKDARSRAFQLD